jgi:Purple acid Phosphatase, N-terminal domain/Calcineurin-like phosphoesterase
MRVLLLLMVSAMLLVAAQSAVVREMVRPEDAFVRQADGQRASAMELRHHVERGALCTACLPVVHTVFENVTATTAQVGSRRGVCRQAFPLCVCSPSLVRSLCGVLQSAVRAGPCYLPPASHWCSFCFFSSSSSSFFAPSQTLTAELDKVCKLLPNAVLRLGCRRLVARVVEDLVHKDVQWRNAYTEEQFCSLLGMCLQPCCLSPVIPEQVHLALTGDPSQMVVMWTTSEETNSSTVQYGTAEYTLTSSATGSMSTYLWGGWDGVLHTVLLSDLSPSIRYHYRVGSPGQRLSEVTYSFVSAPPLSASSAHANYSFAAYGDMGATDVSDRSVMLLAERVLAGQVDVVMHAGDLSYANGVESTWDDYMRKIEPVAAYIPYMVAVGNHEIFFNFTSFKHRFRMPVRGMLVCCCVCVCVCICVYIYIYVCVCVCVCVWCCVCVCCGGVVCREQVVFCVGTRSCVLCRVCTIMWMMFV